MEKRLVLSVLLFSLLLLAGCKGGGGSGGGLFSSGSDFFSSSSVSGFSESTSFSAPVTNPEPSTLALLGIGLSGLVVARRKKTGKYDKKGKA